MSEMQGNRSKAGITVAIPIIIPQIPCTFTYNPHTPYSTLYEKAHRFRTLPGSLRSFPTSTRTSSCTAVFIYRTGSRTYLVRFRSFSTNTTRATDTKHFQYDHSTVQMQLRNSRHVLFREYEYFKDYQRVLPKILRSRRKITIPVR